MRFWDASALVPLCLTQPASAVARPLLEDDPEIAVWWGSPVECWSAFARLRREGTLSLSGEDAARSLLAQLQQAWTEIEPGAAVRIQTSRLLRLHPLRSLDALQLAAALVWAGSPPAGVVVSFDDRLREAARLEGFKPLPE